MMEPENAPRDVRIRPDCPACGGSSLFLGTGGWLTCSYVDCPDPALAISILDAERERRSSLVRHEAAIEHLKAQDPLKEERRRSDD